MQTWSASSFSLGRPVLASKLSAGAALSDEDPNRALVAPEIRWHLQPLQGSSGKKGGDQDEADRSSGKKKSKTAESEKLHKTTKKITGADSQLTERREERTRWGVCRPNAGTFNTCIQFCSFRFAQGAQGCPQMLQPVTSSAVDQETMPSNYSHRPRR